MNLDKFEKIIEKIIRIIKRLNNSLIKLLNNEDCCFFSRIT